MKQFLRGCTVDAAERRAHGMCAEEEATVPT